MSPRAALEKAKSLLNSRKQFPCTEKMGREELCADHCGDVEGNLWAISFPEVQSRWYLMDDIY